MTDIDWLRFPFFVFVTDASHRPYLMFLGALTSGAVVSVFPGL